MVAKLVEEAKTLEREGAAMLDFTNSGPVAGAAVVKAVKIPVIGGFGGGPWLDGRVRPADLERGALDGVAQLAHVAYPRLRLQARRCARGMLRYATS